MKKKFLAFFIVFTLFSNIGTVFAEPTKNIPINQPTELKLDSKSQKIDDLNSSDENQLNLTADSAILIDAKSGEILYEKNCYKKQYPASITKLMTVLLTLEYGKLDEIMTFSKEAVFGIERNSSHIAIDVGEKITIEEGLYAILLQSANEVSLGVAEHIDGSIEAFAKHMTKRAKELGCKNTNFVNSNGLHNDNHYTTAYDMALITKEVLKYDKFREIAATTYYELKPTNLQPESRYLYAQHKMIKKNSIYFYEGCEGGKTGFTSQALNTLVTVAKRGDTELIAVVLKDAGKGTYTDTATLFNYGFENFKTVKAFAASDFSKDVKVTETYKNEVITAGNANLVAESDIYVTLPKTENENKIVKDISCSDVLNAPVEKGSVNGKIEVKLDNKVIGKTNIISSNQILPTPIEELKAEKKVSFIATAKKIFIYSLIALIVLVVIILTVREIIYSRRSKIRKTRRKRRLELYSKKNKRI